MECALFDVLTAYAVLGFLELSDSPVALGDPRATRLYREFRDNYQLTSGKLGLVASSKSCAQ